jgi:hypothetical protein
MEDIRIGRKSASNMDSVGVPNGTTPQILPANPKRVSLTVSYDAGGSGNLFVMLGKAATTSTGVHLTPQNPVFTFTLENCGNLVTQAVFAAQTVQTQTLTYIERVLEDS